MLQLTVHHPSPITLYTFMYSCVERKQNHHQNGSVCRGRQDAECPEISRIILRADTRWRAVPSPLFLEGCRNGLLPWWLPEAGHVGCSEGDQSSSPPLGMKGAL